ncbi:flagellar biosynthesis protein FliL [Bacillus sp. JCM 19046]|uniref:Flagellar protein FliL n=1 Tax=Shouchella xiaoxiensis TaxID=766895 RepID=A0ABS2STR5_9BACI|nr:flagellar basal body-associated protein FliL [Shouchella xiaoxiensis]MBM7837657.1 flagellar FliL protein [Shouchella xiaoxiensis]GAF12888.1 flagellar biosynthesis protein FliL [Bacillus sp. JCM 19045]GAF16744.1 flagellar biosynthesis protein FliL [Bacillus sp. JCM 19046]
MSKRAVGILSSLVIGLAILVGSLYLLELGPFESSEASAKPTIEEINKRSIDTEEVTTNLKSGEFIRAQFRIQLDAESTLEDMNNREFQVKNVLLLSLAETTSEDLLGSEGINELEQMIQSKLNDHLEQGTVEAVYTTMKVVQ